MPTDEADEVHEVNEVVEVVEVAAADCHELRARVLRADTLTREVRVDGDDRHDTFHLGVRGADGRLVAISTWIPRPHPDHPHLPALQLRQMATAPEVRGSGLGARLLDAGVLRARAAGAELVWARARDTALGFYLRHGFVTHGGGYTDASTGLPHHDVVRHLAR